MEHVIGTVAVTYPEVAVGGQGDVRRTIVEPEPRWFTRHNALGVGRRILRITQRPDFLALQRALGDQAVLFIAEVQVFGAAFLADVHAVSAALEHGAEGTHKFAFGIEDDDRVRTLAGGMYSVVNVNVAVGIFHHAVGITVLDVGRQHAPVVNAFVSVFAFTDHRSFVPALSVAPLINGAANGT